MPNPFRSSRRVILLGVVISLAFLGFTLPRPASTKAQEPAKATDKKALREQIIALHAEIDLMEVEQGIDRQALTESIKEERAIPDQLELYFKEDTREIKSRYLDAIIYSGGTVWSILKGVDSWDDEKLRKILSSETRFFLIPEQKEFRDAALDHFGKEFAEELDALGKMKKKEEFSEARWRLAARAMEEIKKKAPESFRQEADPLKKDFVRRSAELAGKKLDLDILERQYREAR
jgi:hypothetical protein